MILPQTYLATLLVMLVCVVCWGSWANTYKAARRRFELYYFDWIFGALLVALLLALTLGSLGFDGFSFRDDLMIAGKRAWFYGLLAGVIFSLGNMLFMAALSLGGMVVAFPVGLGISMVVGAIVNFAIRRVAAITFLLLGCALLVSAVWAAAAAYRDLVVLRHEAIARAGKAKSTRRPGSAKPIVLAVLSGLLLGSFPALLDGARAGDIGMGPYSLAVLFAVGAAAAAFLFNLFFMNLPVEGEPLEIPEYFHGGLRSHLLGLAGGALWCAGLVALLVATAVPQPIQLGRALSTALSQSAAPLAMLCGIVFWKELDGADGRVKILETLTLVFFALGIALLAIALLWPPGASPTLPAGS